VRASKEQAEAAARRRVVAAAMAARDQAMGRQREMDELERQV